MEAIQSMIAKAYTYLKQNLDSHPLLITSMSMEAAALLAGRDGADGTEDKHSQDDDSKSNPRLTHKTTEWGK